MKLKLSLVLLLLSAFTANAQQYAINGIIKGANGVGLESATVFLAGSQRATITDTKGEFSLPGIYPGNYELMVSMLGHAPIKKDIAIRSKTVYIDTVMQVKPVRLSEVKIGGNGSLQQGYYDKFIKAFLGTSANAKSCTILNYDIVEFTTRKDILKAYADDFLVIENKNLGYRIKYLLRNFVLYEGIGSTVYEGESIFEELHGTEEQKAQWAKNRRDTYEGSLMSYLRGIPAAKTREAGFLTYRLINPKSTEAITANPVPTDSLIKRLDNTFFKFRDTVSLFVIYDKGKAAKPDASTTKTEMPMPLIGHRTLFRIDSDIDDHGAYSRAKHYMLYGYWGEKRVGDLLPREYQP